MGPPHLCGGMWKLGDVISTSPTASMGPPHLCGGMTVESALLEPLKWLQWGRRISAAECMTAWRRGASSTSLQWGRRISAAEWQPDVRHGDGGAGWASMGPPHLCGGMGTARAGTGPATRRFNGAAASLRRNAQIVGMAELASGASMGPPHLCGGMMGITIKTLAEWRGLQWGRRISAAEW